VNYPEALAWLYGTQRRGIKLGLDNMFRLLRALDIRTEPPPLFLHVAGTNGKGSVCAMLDAICRAAGHRTGLYTSPHLISFRERIRANGEMISETEAARSLAHLRSIVEHWQPHPTFFEITTALALDHFHRAAMEVVILETGLGGRLDATNTVSPALSVITAVDYDHQAWLGSTLEQIGAEKAGIIKPGVPVLSAPQHPAVEEVLRTTAAAHQSPFTLVRAPLAGFDVALAGSHQQINAALAVEALRQCGLVPGEEAIRRGLRDVAWPGRFQRVGPRLVLDGAHNPAAAARLVTTWREVCGPAPATIILGVLADKDIAAIVRALAPIAARFIAVPVENSRTCPLAQLAAHIREHSPAVPCTEAASLHEALKAAEISPDPILVTGSLFLVGTTLALLNHTPAETSTQ
jgi:dihydrofolate synthase / folylpolyglutamate synthase